MPTPAAQKWTAVLARAEASELTMREFARSQGLNPNTLAWWKWKLGREPRPDSDCPFLEVVVEEPDVTVILALDDLPAHVVVDRQTDLDLLRRMLEALS